MKNYPIDIDEMRAVEDAGPYGENGERAAESSTPHPPLARHLPLKGKAELTREAMEAAAFKVCHHAFTFSDDYDSSEMRVYIDGCMALIDELCGEGVE